MTKLEKIELEAQKAREKIAAIQAQLKQIDGQRTEQENLQIIQQVRALKLSREELYAFINGGELPAALVGAVEPAQEPETIYSRQTKTKYDTKNYESEDIENEDEEE